MSDDSTLLRRYARERSEEAFAELVRRHVDLVYSAALRRVGGDPHGAADVAQLVFSTLARKAGELANHEVLTGWLYTATRNAAINVIRTEQRRRVREQEAHLMNELTSGPEPGADWRELRSVLDAAMDELEARDREAVLARFFPGRPLAEVASMLRVGEDAARKRVERALDRLRGRLERRGITSTGTALGALLANQAVTAAPAALTATITSTTLALGALAIGAGTLAGWAGFFTMTKIKIGLVGAVVVAGLAIVIVEERGNRLVAAEVGALRTENAELARLRQENARLASDAAQAPTASPVAAELGRVRVQVAQAKAKARATGEAEMKAAATWRNAGMATPAATYETQLWARAQGDFEVLGATIEVGKRMRPRLEAFIAGLAEPARTRFNTPEKLVAHLKAYAPWNPETTLAEVVAYRILTPEEAERTGLSVKIQGEGLVQVATRTASGREGKSAMLFTKTKEGWKSSFDSPDWQWEKIMGYFDPATALPKNAKK